jgi:FkbM family methyltransferase
MPYVMSREERKFEVTATIPRRMEVLLKRPDFRRNPLTAIWRRVLWKTRWLVTTRPCPVTLSRGIKMALPNGGAAALIYYQGVSEPETADFVLKFLKPGMVFLDVGAHVGEYTLLAARAVGSIGEVHVFEANPEMCDLLRHNIRLNGLSHVSVNQCAVSDQDGEMEFEVYAEPSVCALKVQSCSAQADARRRTAVKVLRVPSLRMNQYLLRVKRKVDLVKIDVEGAELLVFRGATDLLALPRNQSPTFIFEYEADNYARFGHPAGELFDLLRRNGFGIWRYNGTARLDPFDCKLLSGGTVNLVASKDEKWLRHILSTAQQ